MIDSVRRRTGFHEAQVIVRSLRWRLILYCLRQLFCFDAFPSASGQTRQRGRIRRGSSLTWLSIRIGLQGRKPRESNKLFDLFYRHRTGRFIPVYRLGEDGDLKNEGDGMLSVWALRARSYKTKAEA